MDIYNIIKKYGEGQGKEAMWKSVKHISDYIELTKSDHLDHYRNLTKMVYEDMVGGHYNEDFGMEQIRKMYYKDRNGVKHYAPYWTEDMMFRAYNSAKSAIPSNYTMWDFLVTLNMIASDNHDIIDRWFPTISEEEMTEKCIELSINFLNDDDTLHPTTKIWSYFG